MWWLLLKEGSYEGRKSERAVGQHRSGKVFDILAKGEDIILHRSLQSGDVVKFAWRQTLQPGRICFRCTFTAHDPLHQSREILTLLAHSLHGSSRGVLPEDCR